MERAAATPVLLSQAVLLCLSGLGAALATPARIIILRHLLDWQGVSTDARREGARARGREGAGLPTQPFVFEGRKQ